MAPGVAEISSPLILCNDSSSDTSVTVEIVRPGPLIVPVLQDFLIESKQTELLPLNGQFLMTGESLRLRAAHTNRLVATISYTVGQAEEDDVA